MFVAGFGKFSMENWQVFAVVEIENLQRPRKKITVEYLAWFKENILGSRLRGIIVWKTCTYAGSTVSYTSSSWLRGIRGFRGVEFIHPRYFLRAYVIRTRNIEQVFRTRNTVLVDFMFYCDILLG